MTLPIRRLLLVLAAVSGAGVARADVITDWNNIALGAIRAASSPPPVSSRALAMTQLAVYDAVNAVDGGYQSYVYTGGATPDTSNTAAAAQAAYTVLRNLYPAQEAAFAAQRARSLDAIPDGSAKTAGIALGDTCANAILTRRAADGSGITTAPYLGSNTPGAWRPTPPANAAGLLPNWGQVTPFALGSGSDLRPTAPPTLDSSEYARALNEVKSLGAKNSAARTADQTDLARFWADGGGTATPPGHWNRIAQSVATAQGYSVTQNARLFALMNVAMADAAICAWDAKYAYSEWRPISAIRLADTDSNPATVADAAWEPLLTTPNFPCYVSGHTLFSSAGASVLAAYVGTDTFAFTAVADNNPSLIRTFSRFSDAATEAGMSRIYGGIHFGFDNTAASAMGYTLGAYVSGTQLGAVAVPEANAALLLAGGVLFAAGVTRPRRLPRAHLRANRATGGATARRSARP